MNRELLEKPFEPAQIKRRQGRNGLLDYIEGHSVVHRLNQALDGAWSFEVTHHEIREDEVLVLGKLTAEGITKMQFGVSQITRVEERRSAHLARRRSEGRGYASGSGICLEQQDDLKLHRPSDDFSRRGFYAKALTSASLGRRFVPSGS